MPNIVFDDEISGHDSQVEGVVVDPEAKTVTVSLLSYPSAQSGGRIPIKIVFSRVTSISTIMDLNELANHRAAGNVVQWIIAEKAGTSFIQLCGGCLAITSQTSPTLIEGLESPSTTKSHDGMPS